MIPPVLVDDACALFLTHALLPWPLGGGYKRASVRLGVYVYIHIICVLAYLYATKSFHDHTQEAGNRLEGGWQALTRASGV